MGINGSKFNHKVRKVTPLENKDAFDSPAQIPGYNGSDSLSSYGRVEQSNLIWERQLPPLRETLYGRGLIVPSPLSFDIPLENGNTTSIIKRHPPRRLQKLEPVVLPTIISAERIISNQGQAIGKGMERKTPAAKNAATRRQHMHKMQMQEINRKREEAELKRNLHREVKINKQKMRENKAKLAKANTLRCNEDEDFPNVEHDFNVNYGNIWHWNTSSPRDTRPFPMQTKGKLEMWFKDYQSGKETYSDSSSTDSLDSWIREDRRGHQRPALIRTKAEKIPTFDEFFDREF
ncbi:uncharacterized protein CCDC198 isoform X2 [Xenopus tropicalis]|uniref:Uncharacterized protein CCDC198 isoform X2 n=1 Tax=Xenopus tropicalis TaxID=8364 RepID=A0A8J1ITR8_XENTR|nr:uncharacterized protein CCDC198 isoform X2 [Xenopus tropicalis]